MNLRYLWRSLLSVFVLWFALSPTLCFASETATTESAIEYDTPMVFSISPDEVTSGYLEIFSGFEAWTKSDNACLTHQMHEFQSFLPPYNASFSSRFDALWGSSVHDVIHQFHIRAIDQSILIDKDDVFDFSFSGVGCKVDAGYTWSLVNVGGGGDHIEKQFDISKLKNVKVVFFNSSKCDWSAETITIDITDSMFLNYDNNTYGFNAKSLQIPFDCSYIRVAFSFDDSVDYIDSSECHRGFDGWSGDATYTVMYTDSTISIDVNDKSVGLLNGIIEWLRSIRDGIAGVADSITQLPSKIWTVFENGIKSLFVPSEEDITNMHSQWDELMRDRFGAIYESGDIVHQFAQQMETSAVMVADNGGVISMPSATINVAGVNFTFGGYEVDIVPQGFEWLVQSIKMIVNIVCTIMFINALKSKLEVLLR